MEFFGTSLVTGAAGFMGSHVVAYLAKKGVKVRATARPRSDLSFFTNLGVDYVPADLTDPATLPPLFDGDVDRVFHLGAICNFSTPYESLSPTNVEGVRHLTGLAQKSGVKCFVHVTSTSVYGYYRGTPFKESDERRPMDNYARSKKNGEDIVFEKIKKGLPAIIVRPCTVYGPGCSDGAGKVFSRPSKIVAIPGSGKQRLSNIRAEDVAAAIDHLSSLDQAIGEVYNLAEDTHPTLKEALSLAAQIYGSKPPKVHLPLWLIKIISKLDGVFSGFQGRIPDLEYDAAKYLYYDYRVDNTKLKATGFQLEYPDFSESMRQLEALYTQNCQ
jgi:UDP-glucose 4-epimerase